jgi:hypothetical protein
VHGIVKSPLVLGLTNTTLCDNTCNDVRKTTHAASPILLIDPFLLFFAKQQP